MKEITYNEAFEMLKEYGHQAVVTIQVKRYEKGYPGVFEDVETTILNNGIVYNTAGKQLGDGGNERNAEKVLNLISRRSFKIRSNFFRHIAGEYIIN